MTASIKALLPVCRNRLLTISDSPQLDAELLLQYVCGLSRAQLFTHSEKTVTTAQLKKLELFMQRREQGEPMAYLLGHKEFWDLDLCVTSEVLVPRPETECMIEWILSNTPKNLPLKVADLGVGSGAIALSLAKERPNWEIHATDYSATALAVAQKNAQQHQLKTVEFFQGSWCAALPDGDYDLLVSNPPYLADTDPHLDQLSYEPRSALVAGVDGLDEIKKIILQASHVLKPSGLLVFEHGFDQEASVIQLLQRASYRDVQDHRDLAGLPRFVTAHNIC